MDQIELTDTSIICHSVQAAAPPHPVVINPPQNVYNINIGNINSVGSNPYVEALARLSFSGGSKEHGGSCRECKLEDGVELVNHSVVERSRGIETANLNEAGERYPRGGDRIEAQRELTSNDGSGGGGSPSGDRRNFFQTSRSARGNESKSPAELSHHQRIAHHGREAHSRDFEGAHHGGSAESYLRGGDRIEGQWARASNDSSGGGRFPDDERIIFPSTSGWKNPA